MSYAILVFRGAQKTLAKLPKQDYQKVRTAIEDLAQTPRPIGCKKLTGRPAWRIRVGVYRIIYEIDDRQQTVTIVNIGHRRDIYRSN
jgi:mRNA interferase RelE/StbE